MSRILWFRICLGSATFTVAAIAIVGHMVATAQHSERERVFVGGDEPVPGVSESDDYIWHSRQFQSAARDLIARGECGEGDFKNNSGFERTGTAKKTYVIRCARGTESREISLRLDTAGAYELN